MSKIILTLVAVLFLFSCSSELDAQAENSDGEKEFQINILANLRLEPLVRDLCTLNVRYNFAELLSGTVDGDKLASLKTDRDELEELRLKAVRDEALELTQIAVRYFERDFPIRCRNVAALPVVEGYFEDKLDVLEQLLAIVADPRNKGIFVESKTRKSDPPFANILREDTIRSMIRAMSPNLGPKLRDCWLHDSSGADGRECFEKLYRLLIDYKANPQDMGLNEVETFRVLTNKIWLK